MTRKIIKRAREILADNAESMQRVRAQEQALGLDYPFVSSVATLTWGDAVLLAMNEQPKRMGHEQT